MDLRRVVDIFIVIPLFLFVIAAEWQLPAPYMLKLKPEVKCVLLLKFHFKCIEKDLSLNNKQDDSIILYIKTILKNLTTNRLWSFEIHIYSFTKNKIRNVFFCHLTSNCLYFR